MTDTPDLSREPADTTVTTEDGFEFTDNDTAHIATVSTHPLIYHVVIGCLFIVALFLAFYSWRLGLGSFGQPEPGLWIFIVSIAMLIALPFTLFVKEEFELFNGTGVARVFVMVAGLISFVVLLPLGGFFVAGFVSMVIITRYSAGEKWLSTLIIAVATPIVLYAIFGLAFQAGFPALPEWLTP